ncbi:hypothetical protein AB431_15410 [Mycobacterium sp. EPa45]|nr:hypothetical protein AB431_15410 [Mycobacterium sp. EPa45]
MTSRSRSHDPQITAILEHFALVKREGNFSGTAAHQLRNLILQEYRDRQAPPRRPDAIRLMTNLRAFRASSATSIAKTHAAEAIFRIVDRSAQMCGGLGVSEDLPLARLAREVRPFRIYDGPSEVHRWAIAKRVIGAAKRAASEQK